MANKENPTSLSKRGKVLFLTGLNYNPGNELEENKTLTIAQNIPPYLLNDKYIEMFPNADPFICACEKGYLDHVLNLIWMEKIKLKNIPANIREQKLKTFLSAERNSIHNVSFTPLGVAARYGHLKIVQVLISNGADPSICNKRDGWNIFHIAAYYSKTNSNLVIYLLLTLDIKIIVQKDVYGETPLYYAYKNPSRIKQGIIYTIENNHKFKRYYEELRIRQEQEKKLRRRREVIQLEDKYKKNIYYSSGIPFICACEKGNFDDVKLFIEHCDVYGMTLKDMVNQVGRDSSGCQHTPLSAAISNVHKDIRAYLLENGGDLVKAYLTEFPYSTPFVCACEKGRFDDVKLLIAGHNNVNGSNGNNNNMTLKKYVNQVGKNSRGWERTPLMAAAVNEHFQIVKYLIEQGEADPNIGDSDGYNALFWAAQYSKKKDVIQVLLNHMSINSINQKTKSTGMTPLDFAAKNESIIREEIISLIEERRQKLKELKRTQEEERRIMKYIKKIRGKYSIKFPNGTPFVIACEKGILKHVKAFVAEHLARLTRFKLAENIRNITRNTPIFYDDLSFSLAAPTRNTTRNATRNTRETERVENEQKQDEYESNVENIIMSLQEWSNLEGKTTHGYPCTPLMAAVRFQQFKVIQYLLNECEADPTVVDSRGRNALHIAARYHNTDVGIRMLLRHPRMQEKNVNQQSSTGLTPLDFAYKWNHSDDIINLLRSAGGKALKLRFI